VINTAPIAAINAKAVKTNYHHGARVIGVEKVEEKPSARSSRSKAKVVAVEPVHVNNHAAASSENIAVSRRTSARNSQESVNNNTNTNGNSNNHNSTTSSRGRVNTTTSSTASSKRRWVYFRFAINHCLLVMSLTLFMCIVGVGVVPMRVKAKMSMQRKKKTTIPMTPTVIKEDQNGDESRRCRCVACTFACMYCLFVIINFCV
jgi:hypothetical protein